SSADWTPAAGSTSNTTTGSGRWVSCRSELHMPHRRLELAEDHVAELLALVGLEALHRGDDAGHDESDQQDQGHILDGALSGSPSKGVEPSEQTGVDIAEGAVHRDLPFVGLSGGIVRSFDTRLQTRV